MNWSNLTPIILEKIMFYAAQMEVLDEPGRKITLYDEESSEEFTHCHSWLLTIEKFCRVSVHWKQVAFSSNILFPDDKSIHFGNHELEDEARTLLMAGFISVVKKLCIADSLAFKWIENVTETSLRSIQIEARYPKWSEDSIRSMMDIISKSPNASSFTLCYRLQSQNDALLLWQLLLKIIHCNSKPKTIYLSIDTDNECEDQINWDFIKSSETSGIGSIEFLKFGENFPLEQLYADAISHISKNVEIYQLCVEITADFVGQIQAKCFEICSPFGQINWAELKDYEKVIIKGCKVTLTARVEKVDHPNVHFFLTQKFITMRTNLRRRDLMGVVWKSDEERKPVDLIRALPASKVKTITYPGESECNGITTKNWNVNYLPVPRTTFECDESLAKNLNKFIDDATVRQCFSFQAKSIYYFRKDSKIGDPEKENGLVFKAYNVS